MPTECRPIARMPGNTPMPSARTKIAAKIRSGTARLSTMMARHTRITCGCGVVLRAAPKASGTESRIAKKVPITAIHNVSNARRIAASRSEKSGGSIRPRRLRTSPSPLITPPKLMSMYRHAQTVARRYPTMVRRITTIERVIGGRSDLGAGSATRGDSSVAVT